MHSLTRLSLIRAVCSGSAGCVWKLLKGLYRIVLKYWDTFNLKVGSWSFEGIIILQIYFLICRKALLQRNKQVSAKSKELKVLD